VPAEKTPTQARFELIDERGNEPHVIYLLLHGRTAAGSAVPAGTRSRTK
jgi:hypothetical protein